MKAAVIHEFGGGAGQLLTFGATQRFNQKEMEVSQMKAAVIHEFGDFDVLKHEDIEQPIPKPGHVLVKVLAAGVERLDHYIREGSIVPELPFPHILGADAAGEVADLGAGVTGFEIGQRVIVAPGYPQKEDETNIRPTVTAPSFALPGLHISGTYTQFMEVPAYALIKDETGLKPALRPGRTMARRKRWPHSRFL